jgi:hypothetical protein
MLNWRMKSDKMDNSAFYLPQAKAEQAANQASATSIVNSAGGSVTIAITLTPDPWNSHWVRKIHAISAETTSTDSLCGIDP